LVRGKKGTAMTPGYLMTLKRAVQQQEAAKLNSYSYEKTPPAAPPAAPLNSFNSYFVRSLKGENPGPPAVGHEPATRNSFNSYPENASSDNLLKQNNKKTFINSITSEKKSANERTNYELNEISPPYVRALDALERRCPDHVGCSQWQSARDDGRKFVTAWGEQAASLGWTVRDLFGLHPVPANPAPSFNRLARYDSMGLVWLLSGRPVVALTAETAVIKTASGTITYHRRNKPALGPLGDSLNDFNS
jgi:hypothetical protein